MLNFNFDLTYLITVPTPGSQSEAETNFATLQGMPETLNETNFLHSPIQA